MFSFLRLFLQAQIVTFILKKLGIGKEIADGKIVLVNTLKNTTKRITILAALFLSCGLLVLITGIVTLIALLFQLL